ncbi:carboxymuconolactone decarboxylase family protein [Chloroflexota bacterium]
MSTAGQSPWQSKLENIAPRLMENVNGLRETVLIEGAISVKTKILMMMLCDALLAHPEGVAGLAKRARNQGASDEEIAETLSIAFLMGGMPALVTGANAFPD